MLDPFGSINRKIEEDLKRNVSAMKLHHEENAQKEAARDATQERMAESLEGMALSINTILLAVRENNEINKETFELFQEMNMMLIAKDKNEAESIFDKVLEKAGKTKESIENIEALLKYGKYLLLLFL